MKTRNGFVTNSSSSSFIVAMKDGLTKDEITEKLKNRFSVRKDHPLYRLTQDIIRQIANEVFCGYNGKYKTLEDVIDNWGIEIEEYPDDEMIKLFKKYGNIISAGFSSDGDMAESLLRSIDFTLEDDDIYMRNYGGY